jgi:hypothetical protein
MTTKITYGAEPKSPGILFRLVAFREEGATWAWVWVGP